MPKQYGLSIGHIIGVAAVVAAIPAVRDVHADTVRNLIEDIVSSSGLADDKEVLGVARRIAAIIIAAAKVDS